MALKLKRGGERWLVPAGYLLAIIVPIVGLALGIVALTRPAPKIRANGRGIVVLATIVIVSGLTAGYWGVVWIAR